MFRRKVKDISELLNATLRLNGLEMPLLQKRTIDAFDEVVGGVIAKYVTDKFIRNQTLYVKMTNPALRQDLSMSRATLLRRLKETVGSEVVTDIRFV